MLNQKWEKVPPLLFDYPKGFDSVQNSNFWRTRQFLGWGMTLLIISGCSLDATLLQIVQGPLRQIMPIAEVSRLPFIYATSGSHSTTIIASVDSVNPEISSEKSKSSSGPGKSSQNVQTPAQQKPSLLVPEIPDKDNDQAIGTYKSKIEETQNLLRTIDKSQLTKEQQDTLNTINSFFEKAQEAFFQNDLSMAVNLSEKAHTLAQEIVNNSTKQ